MTVNELIQLLEQIPEKDKDLMIIYDDYERGCCRSWEWHYVHDDDTYAIELCPQVQ